VGWLNNVILNFLSPPNQRRWRGFTGQRRARIGLWIFFLLAFFAATAELWSNHRPLIMIRDVPVAEDSTETRRKVFFPAFVNYTAADLGVYDLFVVDYKEIVSYDEADGKKTFAIFPLNKFDPFIQTGETLVGPSSTNWLGTDNLGRDVTARLLYGMRMSLTFGILFWLSAYIVGIVVGSVQGFYGGRTDFVTERVKEVSEIIPFLTVIIIVNGLMGNTSIYTMLMIVALFFWIGISSQMRAQFLSLRKRDFCEAARALGASNNRIIFKHILPNAVTPILTLSPFAITTGISTLAALDYLGFGLMPPTPSLGELLQQGRTYIIDAPWLLIAPTFALATMLISINMIGDSLRQAFDPKKS
jgi:microcin C transport system permease protein